MTLSSWHTLAFLVSGGAATLVTLPAYGLPTGGSVVTGEASIESVSPNQLEIHQASDRAILHWETFSISPDGQVIFHQPSVDSSTLNRVTGSTPSNIAGQITAQGTVMLVNPNGIVFTPTAQVDVGSLVVSTLDIQDRDFLEGRYRFEAKPGEVPAGIENHGNITVAEGGMAAFIAPTVANRGVIAARLGTVVMASGQGVTLDLVGDGFLQIQVDPLLAQELTDVYGNPLSALVSQSGEVLADGGQVILSAAMVERLTDSILGMDGVIQANRVENQEGRIVLRGDGPGAVNIAGKIEAEGGRLEVSAQELTVESEIGTPRWSGSGAADMAVALELGSEAEAGRLTVSEDGFLRVRELEIDSPYRAEAGEASVVIDNAREDGLHGETLSLNTRLELENFGFNPSSTVNVNTGGSIQNGVNAVADGGTVNIAAGRFVEGNQIEIDRSLTIQGQGSGNDPNSNTIISRNLGGPAYRIFDITADAGTITFDNLRIENGQVIADGLAGSGGGIRARDSNVVLTNSVLADNRAGDLSFGGGIFTLDGDITVSNSSLLGNSSGFDGGAISSFDGIITVVNSTLSNNSAEFGGAIANDTGNISVIGSSLFENSAEFGGGIANNVGQITVINSDLSENSADLGGGIYSREGNVTLNNSDLIENIARDGGGLYTVNSRINLNQSTLSANRATSIGGGVYTLSGEVNLSQSILSDNSSGLFGGGIYTLGGAANLEQSILSGNTAALDGGGIRSESGVVTIQESTLSGNSASVGGGVQTLTGEINISDSTLSGNTADESGGGIAANFGSVSLVNTTLSENIAGSLGGGIASGSGNISLTDSTLIQNSANEGGGIYNVEGDIVLLGSDLSRNRANFMGGGIRTFSGFIALSESALSENSAAIDGGGIYTNSSTVNLDDSVLARNSAGSNGGGIYNREGNTTLISSTISENIASFQGGGINTGSGTVSIDTSVLTRNSAGFGGGISFGGFAINAGPVTLTNSTISENVADLGGGGIYTTSSGSINLINSTALNNSTGGEGGAISAWGDGDITLTNSSLIGNTAASGGGIFNVDNRITLINSTLAGNSANFDGGGIRARVGNINLLNSTLSGNSAGRDGGGIFTGGGGFLEESGQIYLTNSTVTNNTAGFIGGGISTGVNVTLANSLISGNSAIFLAPEIAASITFRGNNLVGSEGNDGILGGSCTGLSCTVPNVSTEQIIGSLADNGGPTQTHTPIPGSPAIGTGIRLNDSPSTDQRGALRTGNLGDPIDIGAVESGQVPPEPEPQPQPEPEPRPQPQQQPRSQPGPQPQSEQVIPDSTADPLYQNYRDRTAPFRRESTWNEPLWEEETREYRSESTGDEPVWEEETRGYTIYRKLENPVDESNAWLASLLSRREGLESERERLERAFPRDLNRITNIELELVGIERQINRLSENFEVGIGLYDFRGVGNVDLLERPIEPDKKTTFYTHGWKNDHNEPASSNFAWAMEQSSSVQQGVMVDWGQGAQTGDDFSEDLSVAAARIRAVARALAERIIESGLSSEDVDLVGHSLGAYVTVEAAYILSEEYNFVVKSVTLLDPANLLTTISGAYTPTKLEEISRNGTSTLAIYARGYTRRDGNLASDPVYAEDAQRSIRLHPSEGRWTDAHGVPVSFYADVLARDREQFIDNLPIGVNNVEIQVD